jgi:hypothetical protein
MDEDCKVLLQEADLEECVGLFEKVVVVFIFFFFQFLIKVTRRRE